MTYIPSRKAARGLVPKAHADLLPHSAKKPLQRSQVRDHKLWR